MDEHMPSDWELAYSEGHIESPLDPYVLELAPTLDIGTALDLGCGAGQNSIWLAQRGWAVTGVDIAPSAIALAEEAARLADVTVEFVVANASDWQPEDSFDFVFSTYALPSKGRGRSDALDTVASSVKPGGTILVADFDRSMTNDRGWSEGDLIDTDELASHLGGFDIMKLSVETTRHAHGHHEELYPIATVVAQRLMGDSDRS